jgi:hypothetical protein
MPNAYQDLYTATKALMAAANAAASTTLTQAPTNYGEDFIITPAQARYQIEISPETDYPRGTVNYPRAAVKVRIHHYANSLANEEAFLHDALFQVAERLLVGSVWSAQATVFSLDIGDEPEMSDGERIGNVISFEVTAIILMNAT